MGLQFHGENEIQSTKDTSSFLTKLLIEKGIVTEPKKAKRVSMFILAAVIVLALVGILVQNTNREIDKAYYSDPEIDNAHDDAT